MYRNKYRLIIPFLLPSVALYVTFVLYPYFQAMYISLTRWRGLSPNAEFIGLENFQRMVTDDRFWNALQNNLRFLATLPLITIAISLFFAFLMTQGVRGAKFYRITFFFPQVMSIVAIGVLWSFVYHPIMGILNSFLRLLGVETPPVWLGNPETALGALGAVVIWQGIGFIMILFIAGMESIPPTFYEAAEMDGANRWTIFWKITLPLLWDTVRTALIFLAIGAVDMFAIVQTMTQGGPSRSTEVLASYLYDTAFLASRFGYATAIAVFMFLMVLVLSIILMRLTRRESLEY
ncbi:MAG: sugar ABC transporter permease [Litorilinea sp.]